MIRDVDSMVAKARLDRLAELCREQGFPLTSQRRVVFEALLERTDHPTAEAIYEEVKRRLPEIHRATVYRTLDRLVDLGVATRVHRIGLAARFDPNVDRHDHAVCVGCGAMEDLEPSVPPESPETPETLDTTDAPSEFQSLSRRGFRVLSQSVQVQVLCPSCRAADKPLAHRRLP